MEISKLTNDDNIIDSINSKPLVNINKSNINYLLLDKEFKSLMCQFSKTLKDYYTVSKYNFQEAKSLFSLIEEIINIIILQNCNLTKNTELENQINLIINGLKSASYSNEENLINFYNDTTKIFNKLFIKKDVFMSRNIQNFQIVNENNNPKNNVRSRTPSIGERQFNKMHLNENKNLINTVQKLFSNFDIFEEILGNISDKVRKDFSQVKKNTLQMIIKEFLFMQNIINNCNFSLLNEKKLSNKMTRKRKNSSASISGYNIKCTNSTSPNIKNLYNNNQIMEKLLYQNETFKCKNIENEIKMSQMKNELIEYQKKLNYAEKKIENYIKVISKNKNIMTALFQKNKILNNQKNQIIINNQNNNRNNNNNCNNLIEKINKLSKDNLSYKNENRKLKLIINQQKNLKNNDLSFSTKNDLTTTNNNIKSESTSSQFYDAKLKSIENNLLSKEKEYKNEITYLTNNNMSLTKDLSAKRKDIVHLEKNYLERTKELKKLKYENSNFNQLIKQLKDGVDKTNKINNEYKNKIISLESYIEKLKIDDKQNEELNKLKESYENMKNLYDTAIIENNKLIEENQKKESEFLSKLDDEKDKSLLEISEKENSYISKIKEIQNANNELSNDITLKENVIQQKDEIIKNLKKKYANNESENLKKLKEKNNLLSADIDEYVLKIEEDKTIIESQKQDIEGLKNFIAKLQNENEKIILKESKRVETNNSFNTSIETSILEKENKKLREQIEHISNELPKEIEELKSENSSLKQQIISYQNIKNNYDINSEHIRSKSCSLSQNFFNEEENNNYKQKCDLLTKENEKLNKQLKNMLKKSIVYVKSNSNDQE